MKRPTLTIIFLLLTVFILRTSVTSQISDRLIYNGDTLRLFTNPLEQLYTKELERPNFFGKKTGCTTAWNDLKGYQANWEIIDNQLYLTGIFSSCYSKDSIKSDLKELFGDEYINGKVKADWVTLNLIAPTGKYIYYLITTEESVYESEQEFQIRNGRLIGTKTYDNSKSRQSIYSINGNKLMEFIYSNINWSSLPKHEDKIIKVFIQFSANENGKVDSVQVVRSYDSIFDNEAVRVVKAIPEWDIFYQHGKFVRTKWTLPIVFSSKYEEKYKK